MKIRLLLFCLAASIGAPAQRIPVDTFPVAAKPTPDGKFLLVLNAGFNAPTISVIDLAASKEISRTPVPDAWLGLAMTRAGDRVYVGGGSKSAIYEFTLANGVLKPARQFAVGDFVGDVQLAPDGHLLYAAALFKDAVIVVNPQSGLVLSRIKTGRRPYRILFHPSGKSLYVSSWADGAIGQYDPNSGERMANLRIAPHTTDMAWSSEPVEEQPSIAGRIFVSAGNTNSVYVLGVSGGGDLTRLGNINLALSPLQPLGTTPTGLGVSGDGRRLFVACSGTNSVAVVDLTGGVAQVTGFIAAGVYPTTAFAFRDGKMGVLNGHDGTVQIADPQDALPGVPLDLPAQPSSSGAFKHVLYFVSDSRLATAGIVPDYEERFRPAYAAGRRSLNDFDGQEPANSPPAGYIWTAANQAGLSMRSYGIFVDNRAEPEADGTQITGVRDPILAPVTDPNFRGPDPKYPDTERAKEFISELADFEKSNNLPQLLLVEMTDAKGIAQISEAVKKSRFGAETAIYTVAQTDPRERQLQILRSVEINLGLHPMTIFDAGVAQLF